jgi:hypothetical protein
LILTGGWLEALHITCQVAKKNPANEKLIEKIGEQKIILDNIKLMLEFYTQDPHIADLHKRVLELEKVLLSKLRLSGHMQNLTWRRSTGSWL